MDNYQDLIDKNEELVRLLVWRKTMNNKLVIEQIDYKIKVNIQLLVNYSDTPYNKAEMIIENKDFNEQLMTLVENQITDVKRQILRLKNQLQIDL